MNSEECFDKGCSYMDKQDFVKAIEWFTKTLDLKEVCAAYENRGIAKSLTGDRPGAIEDFKKSASITLNKLTNHPPNEARLRGELATTFFNLGYNYWQEGNHHSSILFLEKCLTLYPNEKPQYTFTDVKNLLDKVAEEFEVIALRAAKKSGLDIP